MGREVKLLRHTTTIRQLFINKAIIQNIFLNTMTSVLVRSASAEWAHPQCEDSDCAFFSLSHHWHAEQKLTPNFTWNRWTCSSNRSTLLQEANSARGGRRLQNCCPLPHKSRWRRNPVPNELWVCIKTCYECLLRSNTMIAYFIRNDS